MQIPKRKQKAQNPLRKLNKLQLLELLAQQEKELVTLREALAEKEEAALAERTVVIEESGSLAEASLKLSGVFEAAQRAADMYLAGVKAAHAPAVLKDDSDEQEACP